jgi:hypothetical protein
MSFAPLPFPPPNGILRRRSAAAALQHADAAAIYIRHLNLT